MGSFTSTHRERNTSSLTQNDINNNNQNSSGSRTIGSSSKLSQANNHNYLSSYFYLVGQRFESTIIAQQQQQQTQQLQQQHQQQQNNHQTQQNNHQQQQQNQQLFLFGDKSDLNYLVNKSNIHNCVSKFPYKLTTSNTKPTKLLKSLVNIRKDSIKLVKLTDNSTTNTDSQTNCKYTIEFKFDCDTDIEIKIYLFANETHTSTHITYRSTLSSQPQHNTESPVYSYKTGSNQLFRHNDFYIIPSNYNWQQPQQPIVYPIVIQCQTKTILSHSHITLATLELTTFNNDYQIKVIKQKQYIDGICYLLNEIFGIEKKPLSESMTNLSITSDNKQSQTSSQQQQQQQQQHLNEQQQQQNGIIECVICMCDIRDTVILPCRHLCLCKTCANNLKLQSNNCPICRIPFIALIQIEFLNKKKPNNIINHQSNGLNYNCNSNLTNNIQSISLYEAFNGLKLDMNCSNNESFRNHANRDNAAIIKETETTTTTNEDITPPISKLNEQKSLINKEPTANNHHKLSNHMNSNDGDDTLNDININFSSSTENLSKAAIS